MEEIFTLFRDHIVSYTLALPRLVGAFSMLAFLSRQSLGGTLTRNGILLSLALILHPLILEEVVAIGTMSTGLLALIAVKEVIIGSLIGFTIALLFWAIEGVGSFIDNQRGATMASSLDPLSGDQSSPVGTLLINTLLAVFFVTGLFLVFLESLYASYQIWPVTSFFPQLSLDIVFFILKHFGQIVALAVLLGAPAIIAMFVSEFGLMLIGRFAPQLNIFFVSMSVKSAVSSFILVIFIATIISFFSDELGNIHQIFLQLNEAMQ